MKAASIKLPLTLPADDHKYKSKHTHQLQVTQARTCDAVCHEFSQVLFADGFAAGQVAVTKHHIGLALLHQLNLASKGLEEGGGAHNAVRDITSSLGVGGEEEGTHN